MKKQIIFFTFALLTLVFFGCKYDFILPEEVPPIDNSKPISFSMQIVPIFTEKCNSCHKNQSPKLTADVAFSQLGSTYVNTATPASSKIYTFASSGTHYAKVSSTQAALMLAWITQGAKNN